MTIITDVVTALRTRNSQSGVSRLEDMLIVHVAEGVPPLCVLGHNYHDTQPVLHQIVTQEMHVLHALARKDIDTVLDYLNARAGNFAAPACISQDESLPFVWYAQVLAKNIQKEPTLEKWDWLSKVVQRSVLEDRCPKPTQTYDPSHLLHFHIAESERDVTQHPSCEGISVFATPEHIYIVTGDIRRKYKASEEVSQIVLEHLAKTRAPKLKLQTIYEEQTYDITIVQGSALLYKAVLATTSVGQYTLVGESVLGSELPAHFIPPTKQSEAVFLYAFDCTGKGVFGYKQAQLPFSAVSVSIVDP